MRSDVLDKLMSTIFCRRNLAARSFFVVATVAGAADPTIKLSEPPLPFRSFESSSSSRLLPNFAQQSLHIFSQLLVSHCVNRISNFRISDSSMLEFVRRFESDIIKSNVIYIKFTFTHVHHASYFLVNLPNKFATHLQ